MKLNYWSEVKKLVHEKKEISKSDTIKTVKSDLQQIADSFH